MAYISFQPNDYFNTKLYTGNGSTQSITGVGFAPDMVWTKKRSATDFHAINDKVRGALKIVFPNTTGAEDTSSGCLTSFDSDGFSLGSNSGFNANTATFASWNWLANGQGSSNTDGSINTTYTSANTTSGFSISTYTGTGANGTVGHGLGVAPKMIIFKNTNTATSWDVYHGSLANTERIHLNTTGAKNTAAHAFNSTSPTTAVFSVGTADNTNKSSSPMIAYCFAEKKGFSKFGSYTGNGNADGSFIYTGFKPAWIMIKRSDAAEGWLMMDNKRLGYNPDNEVLIANTNEVEFSSDFDILSNGFKLRTTLGNASSGSYIYIAFAEAPLVSSNGIPAVAR